MTLPDGDRTKFQLSEFRSDTSLSVRFRLGCWHLASHICFMPFSIPRRLRPPLLRLFGARIGRDCVIREHAYVLAPWNLELGDHVWIGRGVTVLNHARVTIGANSCVSQEAMLCSSGHDPRSPDFRYRHRAVVVGENVWIAARAIVLPGATVPSGVVVGSGSTFRGSNDKPI